MSRMRYDQLDSYTSREGLCKERKFREREREIIDKMLASVVEALKPRCADQ